jgi:ribonuclease D
VQEDYALSDVRHLHLLRQRLEERLRDLGRLSWLEEECEFVAGLEPSRRDRNGEAYLRIKGAGRLPPRGLAVLRELAAWRDRRAEERDVPPFRILDPKALLLLSSRPPSSRGELHRLGPSFSRQERNVVEILEAVAKAMALPENDLPGRKARPRPGVLPLTARRVAALRAWRVSEAARLGLDVSVVLPQRLLDAVAEANPGDVASLVRIEGFRRWRAEALGPGILDVLA